MAWPTSESSSMQVFGLHRCANGPGLCSSCRAPFFAKHCKPGDAGKAPSRHLQHAPVASLQAHSGGTRAVRPCPKTGEGGSKLCGFETQYRAMPPRSSNGEFPLKNLTPKPPSGLSPAAGKWWKKLLDEYGIEDAAGLLLLETALQAHDRMHQARELIVKYGAVTSDRFGQLRPNPATTIERDSRAAMMAGLKALNLDIEPLRDAAGRPPGK